MHHYGITASEVVLGVHGGTGITRAAMTPSFEERLREGLTAALERGHATLRRAGATSLDAVEAAVRELEDRPEFNAGKGAVFNHEGVNELDAAIMEGKEKRAGAIAGVTHIRNPITAARAVMERSEHVLMISAGAEAFLKSRNIEMVDASYFFTQERWDELQEAKKIELEKRARPPGRAKRSTHYQWGTVGSVAVDANGTVAVATSTGGMTNKRFGRVGDSPLLGSGTYADNAAGAVSATGHGEFFIRYAVAHEILSLVKYSGKSIAEAARWVVEKELKAVGGEGAVIGLSPSGEFVMSRNCESCYRGYVQKDGSVHVFIFDT
jgi:L-asparaginase / beta-aspartyl-peptidase